MPTKILLVDDSPTAISRYGRLLRGEGYEVVTASSRDEAISLAGSEQPDLAIVDFHMADTTGDELTHELLNQGPAHGITVVMLSGDEHAVHAALSAGAIDLIHKDEASTVFLKRIAAISRAIEERRRHSAELEQIFEALTGHLGLALALLENGSSRAVNAGMSALARGHGGVDEALRKAVDGELGLRAERIRLDSQRTLVVLKS